jgi:hypothetical protein
MSLSVGAAMVAVPGDPLVKETSMKRMAIGAVVGLATWFGSALAAEAQQITPTGPLAILTGNTTATYTADVTIPYLQAFCVDVWVYRGNNPTPVSYGEVYVYYPTTLTSSISFAGNWNPGAITGEKFKFKATLVFLGVNYNAADKIVTVTRPSTYLESSRYSEFAFEAIDRDRRHEA